MLPERTLIICPFSRYTITEHKFLNELAFIDDRIIVVPKFLFIFLKPLRAMDCISESNNIEKSSWIRTLGSCSKANTVSNHAFCPGERFCIFRGNILLLTEPLKYCLSILLDLLGKQKSI